MRADLARADRFEEIRSAAKAWKQAGVIDESACAAIATLYPDDRVRLGPVFRALLFLFTLVAVVAGVGFLFVALGLARTGVARHAAVLFLVSGAALAVLTDVLTGPARRRQGGVEAATSLAAIGCLMLGSAVALFEVAGLSAGMETVLAALASVLFAVAGWRWGYWVYAAASAATFLVLVARISGTGRLLWIVIPIAVFRLLLNGSESGTLPPAHRRALLAVLVVLLGGLYVAVHLGSFDAGLIEQVAGEGRGGRASGSGLLRPLSIAGTALVPLALLTFALRTRRRPLLLLGVLFGIASLVTLRAYVHVAPLWIVLTLSGGVSMAAAVAIRRWLASGQAEERHGFTSDPLFTDERHRATYEGTITVAALASARTSPADDRPRFQGGGGRSGGAGATGEF